MLQKNEATILGENPDCVQILRGGEFRVDHPFRSTRKLFGPSVLDTEGQAHTTRKRSWLSAFSRAHVQSEPVQELLKACVIEGMAYAKDNGDLFLATEYIPNRVVLNLLGRSELDPLEHYEKIRPIIWFLENGEKPEGLADAMSYLLATTSESSNELFLDLSEKERSREVSVFAVAGSETTVVAMKKVLHLWLKDLQGFKRKKAELGLENFAAEVLQSDPPLGLAPRFCVEDTKVGSHSFSKGDIVHINIPDANEGASEAGCPLHGAAMKNGAKVHDLTFGYGKHHCPGHLLAKEELYLFIEFLGEMDPKDFEVSEQQPDFKYATFRHPASCKVTPVTS